MVTIKSARELQIMRKAGQIVAQILDEMQEKVAPGISTGELDAFAEKRIHDLGAEPAFKGYHDFPACVCISVNEEVVHGIPSFKKILKEGDIVGLDFGVKYQGYYGDSARTVPVGAVSPELQQLMDATKECLYQGIDQCHPGNKVFDIGHAIEQYINPYRYGIVREFVGHGIGRALHEDPQVPNFGAKGKGMELREGMVIAIEPMINLGTHQVKVLNDGWTAVTVDGKRSAHFEHTVAITAKGPEILTFSEKLKRA